MIRPRYALVAALALASIGVGGCSRVKDATEGSVHSDVEDRLLEDGYVVAGEEPVPEPIEVNAEDADAIGACVGRTMFEDTARFSKEERNAATSVADGDNPDPDLVLKVEQLVNECYDEIVNGTADEGSSDESQTSGDEETTTTEG